MWRHDTNVCRYNNMENVKTYKKILKYTYNVKRFNYFSAWKDSIILVLLICLIFILFSIKYFSKRLLQNEQNIIKTKIKNRYIKGNAIEITRTKINNRNFIGSKIKKKN